MDSIPVRIISDAPQKREADFGFAAYVDTIADLIAFEENQTPLVIGVYGKGVGRSSPKSVTIMKLAWEGLRLWVFFWTARRWKGCMTWGATFGNGQESGITRRKILRISPMIRKLKGCWKIVILRNILNC